MTTIAPMRTIETQAPEVNLVTPATTNTMPVITAPMALKARLRRQRGWSRWCRQCMIMPVWDRVNARNTPTA
jgi:hypothetical protein